MSYIGKNIKKIRTVKKLSQAAFAELFNIARPSVGSYEEGRAEPKIDTIIQIANYFGLSIDILLNKELTINDLYKFDLIVDELSRNTTDFSHLTDSSPAEGMSYVREEIYLEYIVNLEKRDFIENLQRIQIPCEAEQDCRAFQLNGSEMEYNHNGLHHGDILSTVRVSEKYTDNIILDRIYVIVTKKYISTRRLSSFGNEYFEFRSDDPNYLNLKVKTDEILELWQVRGVYSRYMNPPSVVESRILQIENEIKLIKSKLG